MNKSAESEVTSTTSVGVAPAAPPVAAPAAPPAKDWEAEFKAADKRAAKAEKASADLTEKFTATNSVLEKLKSALIPGDDKADPAARLDELQKRASRTESVAKAALIRSAAMQAAIAAGVRPDRVPHALRQADFSGAEVDLESGNVTNAQDVFAAAFAGLKTDVPEFFTAPAAPPAAPERGAPVVGKIPPTGQPQNAKPLFKSMSLSEFNALPFAEQKKQREMEKSQAKH